MECQGSQECVFARGFQFSMSEHRRLDSGLDKHTRKFYGHELIFTSILCIIMYILCIIPK